MKFRNNGGLTYSISRALHLLRTGQFRTFVSALIRKFQNFVEPGQAEQYRIWISKNETNAKSNCAIAVDKSKAPLITLILRCYKDQADWHKTLESLRQQTDPQWELLISTSFAAGKEIQQDERIRSIEETKLLDESNGEYLGLIFSGDTLASGTIHYLRSFISQNPGVDFLYSDEDHLDRDGNRHSPRFKPDWSPEFFSECDYIARLRVIRKSIVQKEKEFLKDEYVFLSHHLPSSTKIKHIPFLFYHNAEEHALQVNQREKSLKESPPVTIIIPTRDQAPLLKKCVESILQLSNYTKYEILIVNNESKEHETLKYFENLSNHSRVRLIDYSHPFNFSALNNSAVNEIQNEYVIFLNNDTEIITADWIQEMLLPAMNPSVGAVGVKLLYSDETIQHGGLVIGLPQIAASAHRNFPATSDGYMMRLRTSQNVSAVTAACMMVRKSLFQEIGGFDENLSVAFNDVDFCLRLRAKGYRIVWTPYAELYHFESKSRGYEISFQKQQRLEKEAAYFLERWKEELENGDPYYSPNLSLDNGAFKIRI